MKIRLAHALLFFVLAYLLSGVAVGSDERKTSNSMDQQVLGFTVKPIKPTFRIGENVALRFGLKNLSSTRIFVSRYMPIGDFVTLSFVGPNGKEVPWHGKIRSIAYGKDAFLFLEPGQEVSASQTIPTTKDEGFAITRPGRYTIVADYSLGPPEYFANLAPKEAIPQGSFKAPHVHFMIASKNAKP